MANYHYEDFTETNYRSLLRLAKQNFQFATYPEAPQRDAFVLWRHDIDFSIHRALALAQIEQEEGVQATYFLLLNSQFYNLFEMSIREKVQAILKLGHHIGLHFNMQAYPISDEQELDVWLRFEKEILEKLFQVRIEAFSLDNPLPIQLEWCRRFTYAGMINTYADFFRQSVGYCSDSNGYWRMRRLEDVLQDKQQPRLQVLTHPEWWQKEPMSPRQRVQRCLEGRAQSISRFYDRFLVDNQRENVR